MDSSFGTRDWTTGDPVNMKVSDNVRAISSFSATGDNTYYFKSTNFGFSIPAGATIDGIVVEVERQNDESGAGGEVRDARVRIVKADGTIGTTDKADTATNWPVSDAYKTYGSSSDLWGETWSHTDINDADFGVALSATKSSGASTIKVQIDHMRITVYYTASAAGQPTIRRHGLSQTQIWQPQGAEGVRYF